MKYFELTKEERKILEDFEKGKLTSIKDTVKQKKLYQKYAKNTLSKTRNINIRLSEKVLAKLKAEAVQQGIPYQTLASSVLHQFVSC
ncbi:hypothetical protein ISS85_01880 [Candidatus Microgenomates bacterium]|nr:hypothetical protein [Candidatus Microgenomates bacterium]